MTAHNLIRAEFSANGTVMTRGLMPSKHATRVDVYVTASQDGEVEFLLEDLFGNTYLVPGTSTRTLAADDLDAVTIDLLLHDAFKIVVRYANKDAQAGQWRAWAVDDQ